MKKLLKSLSFLMVLGAIISVSSCGSDDDDLTIIDPGNGGGEGSFAVADGIYIAGISGTDTTVVNAARLTAAQVEDEGFSTQDRDGFVRAWVYLEAGDYFFADIDDQNLGAAFGGTKSTVTLESPNADLGPDSYEVVDLEENGPSFAIANTGVHFVSFDNQTDEALIIPVGDFGLIGSAVFSDPCTGVGFSSDVTMTKGESTAEGTTWTTEGVILKDGAIKFRMDDVWKVSRLLDPEGGLVPSNGYIALLNLGGASVDVLVDGGPDIPYTDENGGGVYDVSLELSASGQISATLTRTGDAAECAFDPANFDWGIIGEATQGTTGEGGTDGWADHKKLTYLGGDGGVHVWRGIFPMETGVPFKFRISGWVERKSPGGENSAGAFTSNFEADRLTDVDDGADRNWVLNSLPGGFVYAVISTSDEGETWDLTMGEGSFGVVGNGSPAGEWPGDMNPTPDVAMTYSDDLASVSISGSFTTETWKVRINESWDFNLGGTLDGTTPLNYNGFGDDFSLGSAGEYTLTITTEDGGETYTGTAAASTSRK